MAVVLPENTHPLHKGIGYLCYCKSFARILQKPIIGLPIIECPECVDETNEGDKLKVDLNGTIINYSNGKPTNHSFPEFIQDIIKSGA